MVRRRSGRSRRSKDAFPWFTAVVSGVVLLLVIGGFSYVYMNALSQNRALGADLCPELGPAAQTIVLVDATDAIAPLTQTEISTRLQDIGQSISRGEKLELRTLQPGDERTHTIFARCNPGDGSDLDHLTANPESARQRWRESFSAPLHDAMQTVMGDAAAETSPIMAALQQIAVENLTSEHNRSIRTHIIIISDMLENSPHYSIYRSGPDFDAYMASAAPARFNSDLAGAMVEIWYLRRNTRIASVPLMEFWFEWIATNRGQPGRALSLQGLE